MAIIHVRVVALISLSVLLSISTWLGSSVISPYLARLYDVPETDTSLLTVATQAGFIVGAVLLAITMLPDRVDCRHLMSAGAFVAAIANALLLVAPNFACALVCRTVTGMCMAFIYPPSTKVLATWFVENRGLAMGWLVGAIAPGSAVPNLIKALPVGNLWASRSGFVILTVSTSALSLIGGAIPLLFLRSGPHPFPRSKNVSCQSSPRALCSSRGGALAIAGYCGHMWELYAVWSSLPLFLDATLTARGYSDADATFLAALISFIAISIGGAGCVCAALLAQRWGRIGVCVLCTTASGTCCLLVGDLASAAPLPVTVALLVFWGFVVLPDSPQYTTLITELVEPSLVGTALVVQQALGYVMTLPTVFIMPLLASEAVPGWRHAYTVLAPGAACAIVALLKLRARLRAPELLAAATYAVSDPAVADPCRVDPAAAAQHSTYLLGDDTR